MRKDWKPRQAGAYEVALQTEDHVRRNLAWLIKERDVEQQNVEYRAGVGNKTIPNALKGVNAPSLHLLAAYAAILRCEPWQLLLPPATLRKMLEEEGNLGQLRFQEDETLTPGKLVAPVRQNKGAKRTSPTGAVLSAVSYG